jgi:hypothetical protein
MRSWCHACTEADTCAGGQRWDIPWARVQAQAAARCADGSRACVDLPAAAGGAVCTPCMPCTNTPRMHTHWAHRSPSHGRARPLAGCQRAGSGRVGGHSTSVRRRWWHRRGRARAGVCVCACGVCVRVPPCRAMLPLADGGSRCVCACVCACVCVWCVCVRGPPCRDAMSPPAACGPVHVVVCVLCAAHDAAPPLAMPMQVATLARRLRGVVKDWIEIVNWRSSPMPSSPRPSSP